MLSSSDCEAVLNFWFGELDASGVADSDHEQRWFRGSAAFDAEVRERFLALHGAVCEGAADAWLVSPRGCLAVVVVLDQFSRNMFRDTPDMFAHDARALAVSNLAIERGDDRKLAFAERPFLYMPFEHSESRVDQERSVALFESFRDQVDPALRDKANATLGFALRHRDIIGRFGRFPHRNAVLERTSTEAELEFLRQPNSSF